MGRATCLSGNESRWQQANGPPFLQRQSWARWGASHLQEVQNMRFFFFKYHPLPPSKWGPVWGKDTSPLSEDLSGSQQS